MGEGTDAGSAACIGVGVGAGAGTAADVGGEIDGGGAGTSAERIVSKGRGETMESGAPTAHTTAGETS